jgi:LAO/AO transport system kinase
MQGIDYLIKSAKKGDRRAIGRLITILENRNGESEAIRSLIEKNEKKAFIVGITGPPGVGKSSLISRLVDFFENKEKLAVIMIDATSPFSGGSLLGNRLRLSSETDVYVRSMATRGNRGGLNLAIGDTLNLLSFVGFSMIIVESVGAGQDETDILYFADKIVLVLAPGTGDQVQAMKAGQMEIGDFIVLNKADKPDVIISEKELMEILSIPDTAKRHKFFKVSSMNGTGIDELGTAITKEKENKENGIQEKIEREREKLKQEMTAIILGMEEEIEKIAKEIVSGELTEEQGIKNIIKKIKKAINP